MTGSRSRTCRVEVLDAFRRLEGRTGHDAFSPMTIVGEMEACGTPYTDSTIRTHVVAKMCIDAPNNHAVTYDDLERVARGQYRRISS